MASSCFRASFVPCPAICCQREVGFGLIAIQSPFPAPRRFTLQFLAIGVIHVVTAVIAAEGDRNMNTLQEETGTPTTAAGAQPKPNKKAARAPRRLPGCARQGQVGQEGQPRQVSAQRRQEGRGGQNPGRPRRQQAREDPGAAETARRRYIEGAHESHRLVASFGTRLSVRHGGQEDGLIVTSTKGEDGERSYSVKA